MLILYLHCVVSMNSLTMETIKLIQFKTINKHLVQTKTQISVNSNKNCFALTFCSQVLIQILSKY